MKQIEEPDTPRPSMMTPERLRAGSGVPSGTASAEAGATDAAPPLYHRAVQTPFWYVYVLVSETLTRTYVGVALDVNRRLSEHNGELRSGAKSTRAGRPWRIGVVYGPYSCRGEAQRIERRVKKLTGTERLALLARS